MALSALARRALRDSRTRMIGFFYLFAVVAYIQPTAYRHAYPTLSDRLAFAHSFANNKAVVLFYGKAYDLLTPAGYSAWRVAGTLTIFGAIFGLLAAIRALRTEEDAGRTELVAAQPITRGTVYTGSLLAVASGCALLWLALFAGSILARLPTGGSAFLALSVVCVVPVFVGVGALASQIAPNRRMALELGLAALALALLLRVIADTVGGAGWLRWLTPLGWAEELRPFTSPHPVVLLLPVLVGVGPLGLAGWMTARRDIGTGLVAPRERTRANLRLLSSPIAQGLRAERRSLIVWLASVGAFALIIGVLARSAASAGVGAGVRHALARLGVGSTLTPTDYIAFCFTLFVLVVSLFAISQVAAARQEEAAERLETLLALPVGRRRWLGGRLLLAAIGAAAVSLTAGLLTWAGALAAGARVPFGRMIEAGANCLPVALLFLGLAALLYGWLPRASTSLAYGLVAVAFLWQLVGSLLGAPHWLVDATPFAHVGLVPLRAFKAGAAAIMLGLGAAAALLGSTAFRRRDLLGA